MVDSRPNIVAAVDALLELLPPLDGAFGDGQPEGVVDPDASFEIEPSRPLHYFGVHEPQIDAGHPVFEASDIYQRPELETLLRLHLLAHCLRHECALYIREEDWRRRRDEKEAALDAECDDPAEDK